MNRFKKVLIFALSLVMIFQLSSVAFAQTETDDQEAVYGESITASGAESYSAWDIEKDFATGWTADGWRIIKGGQLASDGITAFSDYVNINKAITGGGSGWFSWIGSPAAFSFPTSAFTIEATLRTGGEVADAGNKFGLRFDTTKAIELYLGHGTQGYVSIRAKGTGGDAETYKLDTTVWHDYRLVVEADRTYTLYVDEVIALEGLPAGTASTSGGNLVKFGAEGDQACNLDIQALKFANSIIAPPPVQRIKSITLGGETQKSFGEAFSPQITITTDVIDDGTEFVASLYTHGGTKVTTVPDQNGTIIANLGTLEFNIPAGTPIGKYYIQAVVEGLEGKTSEISVLEIIGEKPVLPEFELVGEIIPMEDYIYNPTEEFNFPSIVDTSLHPIDNPLARYYMFYSPHNAPAGICLATADSLDGPWTEYGSNPIVSKDWDPNYNVSHVSSSDVMWNSVYECYFMYFHGENNVTRYATSEDLLNWEYGNTCVYANDFSPTGTGHTEASYARVYEHSVPELGNKYIMTIMINNTANMRKIFWAHSVDGISWTAVKQPLLTPDNSLAPDGIDYKKNFSGAYFMPWEGRFLVFAHASSGDIYTFEVGERLNLEKHWGVLFDDESRAGAPCFIKDDEGRWHMFFEGAGARLHANIIHAVEKLPLPPNSYNISSEAGVGGTILPTGNVAVVSGNDQLFTFTPNTGYETSKVIVDNVEVALSNSYQFSGVVGEHSIRVEFKEEEIVPTEKYTISAGAGVGGTILPTGNVAVVSGNDQLFTFTPNTGYEISKVIVDGVEVALSDSYQFSAVVGEHSIRVEFKEEEIVPTEKYTISAEAGVGGTISPAGNTIVDKGTDITFAFTPNHGYKVSGVMVDGKTVSDGSFYSFATVSANHTIQVEFEKTTTTTPKTQYEILATAGVGGTIQPSGKVSYDAGSQGVYALFPDDGYIVDEVKVNGVSVGAVTGYIFTQIDSNQTIQVTFKVEDLPNPDPDPTPNLTVSGPSGKSSGGGGGKSSATVASAPSKTAAVTETISTKEALGLLSTSAAGKEANAKTVSIKVTNKKISLETLNALKEDAVKKEVELNIILDQVINGKVQVRQTLSVKNAVGEINGNPNQNQGEIINKLFTKYFSNRIFTVCLDNNGQQVQLAVMVPKEMKTDKLAFYTYDLATNRYAQMKDISYTVDANGFVHFPSKGASNIIISDGVLAKLS